MFNKAPCAMQTLRHDTKAWKLQVWISFGTALTLAKALRDAHEAALEEACGQRHDAT